MKKEENNLFLGCIADDFTGASDAASFLVKGGLKTVLINGIPEDNLIIDSNCSAIDIALKTRTQNKKEAVEDTKKAAQWLKDRGVKQLFIKYCSTFDSTREGNIGPIVDSILETYKAKYTILCPALPINKRTVKDGYLYVDGIPLNESSMKNHALAPMWESDIAKLMEPQGKYKSLKINYETFEKSKEEILAIINEFGKDKEHFYVIPDLIKEEDAKKIVETFGDLEVLTGGSGLMTELGYKYSSNLEEIQYVASKTKGNGLLKLYKVL